MLKNKLNVMYKKIGKIEKQMFEYHRANPALAQMAWSEARCFKEAANLVAEQVVAVLMFATRDMKLQHLTAKCYKEWCEEHALKGVDLKDYNHFLRDTLRIMCDKLQKDFNLDAVITV